MDHPLFWVLFNIFVVIMLALDLGVLNRRPHEIGFREAVTWSLVWVGLAAAFRVCLFLAWPAGRPRVRGRVPGRAVAQHR